jgi:TonB family protein
MTALLDATVRVSVVLLAGLIASSVLHRRSAAVRHALLAAAIAAAAAVVPLSWWLPIWTLSLPAWWSPANPVGVVVDVWLGPPSALNSPGADLGTLLMIAWLVGATVSLIGVLVALRRLSLVARRATPIVDGPWRRTADEICRVHDIGRPILLLQTDAPALLATWGMRRPRIALPSGAASWSEDRIRAVLCHEIAHIRRADWIVQLASQLGCVWQWFNPLCWLALGQLRQFSELASDDMAITSGLEPREYALHLLEITKSCRSPRQSLATVPMARSSTFERRITAMLNHSTDRRPLSRSAVLGTLFAVSTLMVPTAAITAEQVAKPATAGAAENRPQETQKDAKTLRVGGAIKPPRKIHDAKAVYPEAMKDAKVSGNVELEVTVGKDGAVRNVHVLTTDVHPDLAVAAVDAVRQWRFEPTLLNGAPVEIMMKCTIAFRLKD